MSVVDPPKKPKAVPAGAREGAAALDAASEDDDDEGVDEAKEARPAFLALHRSGTACCTFLLPKFALMVIRIARQVAPRASNLRVHFAAGHPLAATATAKATYWQKARSKLTFPILAGARPPKMPSLASIATRAGRKAADAYAEYMLTLHRPWSKDSVSAVDWEAFVDFMQELHNQCESDDEHVRCVARHRVFAITNLTNGLKVDSDARDVLWTWRTRQRTTWKAGDFEKHAELDPCSAEDHTAAVAMLDALTASQEVPVNARSLQDAMVKRSFVDHSLQCLDEAFRGSQRADADAPPPEDYMAGALRHTTPQLVGAMNTALREGITTSAPLRAANDASLWGSMYSAKGAAGAADGGLYAGFSDISAEQYAEERAAWWQERHQRPLGPLNPEQRAVCRELEATFLSHVKAARQSTGASVRDVLQGCGEGDPCFNAPHILLHGAPGTGKSAVVTQLRAAMAAKGYGDVLICAYTGVAASLLPGGRTILRLFGFSYGSAVINELNANVLQKIDGCVDRKNLSVVIVDECSMITPHLLHKLDRRLRQIMEVDRPFGGLAIVLCGDFWQLPPPTSDAMHVCLLKKLAKLDEGAMPIGGSAAGGSAAAAESAPDCADGDDEDQHGEPQDGCFAPDGAVLSPGLQAFSRFRRFELTQPMRTADCKARPRSSSRLLVRHSPPPPSPDGQRATCAACRTSRS